MHVHAQVLIRMHATAAVIACGEKAVQPPFCGCIQCWHSTNHGEKVPDVTTPTRLASAGLVLPLAGLV